MNISVGFLCESFVESLWQPEVFERLKIAEGGVAGWEGVWFLSLFVIW